MTEAAAEEPEETENPKVKRERIGREATAAIIDILTNRGLYYRYDASTDVGDRVEEMLRDSEPVTFDTYCVRCKRESTFRVRKSTVATKQIPNRPGEVIFAPVLFATQAICQRASHVYAYIFTVANNHLVKIGQWPSTADLSYGELRGIDRALDEQDRAELGTALGLFAHGTALGAFVYLRRVFERMVLRAHDRQSKTGKPVEGFETLKMHERIEALADELPDAVVENSQVFSVLSIGIHELTEDDCAEYFPVVKAVLFQMLEEEEHKRKAALTTKKTEAELKAIISKLRAPRPNRAKE